MGAEVAAERGDDAEVASVLADRGYEPYRDEGVLRLRNCPFGRLAEAHRDLVCQANLAFMQGCSTASGAPASGRCWSPAPGAAASPSADRPVPRGRVGIRAR